MLITDQVATAPCTDPIQESFPILRQSSRRHKVQKSDSYSELLYLSVFVV